MYLPKNPILFGIIASVIVYFILYLENKRNPKKSHKISFKFPLITGLLVAGTGIFFNKYSSNVVEYINDSIDEEIFLAPPGF